MHIIEYESRQVQPFPWMQVLLLGAVNSVCIAALFILPILMAEQGPVWASIYNALFLGLLVILNFWASLRCRRALVARGRIEKLKAVRYGPFLFLAFALVSAGILTPALEKWLEAAKTRSSIARQKTTFGCILDLLTGDSLSNGAYPDDLRVILREPPASLPLIFANASPKEIEDMKALAFALSSRAPTPMEEEYIEKTAHIYYVGHHISCKADPDLLIIYSRSPVNDRILLGFSSRVEHIPVNELAGELSRQNLKRAAIGLPPLPTHP